MLHPVTDSRVKRARLFLLRLGVDDVAGIRVDVDLYHLAAIRQDLDFPDCLAVLLLQLGFDGLAGGLRRRFADGVG